jgi:hypothetical protein
MPGPDGYHRCVDSNSDYSNGFDYGFVSETKVVQGLG